MLISVPYKSATITHPVDERRHQPILDVTIKDGTGNGGFMTKYNSTTATYYAAVHLANALQLTASGGYLTAPADSTETAPANARDRHPVQCHSASG